MSARSCPFKITDGLVSVSDQEDQDRKHSRGAYVPIEINQDLKIKRSIEILDGIDDAYKVLYFFKTFYKLQVKMDLHDPATSDQRKELLESLLAGPALEVWIQMKEENGIDPIDEVDEDMYQEVVRDFLLEVITIETPADTLAWLKDVRKPYDMKVSKFLSQIRRFNNLLKFMPRIRTLNGLGNAVDVPNKILNENDITLLVRRAVPESW